MNYFNHIPFSQDEKEFVEFIDFAKESGVKSYLEIGARHGGSFLRMVENLQKDGRYIAIDYPGGPWGKKKSRETLSLIVTALNKRGYKNTMAFFGNSHDKETINFVSEYAPFDLIFIDADHSYEAVKKDFYNYSKMAPIVALHDINGKDQSNANSGPVEVWKFWDELKAEYRHFEIINKESVFGIGIIWTSK